MTVDTISRSQPISPLASATPRLAALPAGVRVRELPFLVQLDLRLDPHGPQAAAVADVLGAKVPQVPCTSATAGDVSVLWLGPDEWLVVAPPERTDLLGALESAVNGGGAVVDVSAQRTTISLSGPKARDLLAHGCAADLHPRVSPAGTCLQTLLALTGVILVVRDDTASDFWLLVRSSFARYLADWIVDACVEYHEDPDVALSVFDLFTVGIGPSSSHTVGPMRAARTFATSLEKDGLLEDVRSLRGELFGSLGATGHGHGSVKAVVLGLLGEAPDEVDPAEAEPLVTAVRESRRLALLGRHGVEFDIDQDVVLHRRKRLPFHTNGMRFTAYGVGEAPLSVREYYSVGGGFVLDESQAGEKRIVPDSSPVRYPFTTGAQLLAHCRQTGLPISQVMLANELTWRTEQEVRAGLLRIWAVMQECVERGCRTGGVLPGGLKVRRRAAALRHTLASGDADSDQLAPMDWVTLWALAVNEENASGGRVVTAPTNGAAGIIPAVLHYAQRFVPSFTDDGVVRFLLTAAAVGVLFKENASISGAEVGCQGEVGSACSMASAGLAEVLGATPEQVENAAEIGIEHNLGLTCDPVGGLVQIPCIERNAVASVKAITAARLAIRGDGQHHVSLDKAIKTMRETGADMKDKYKETARGGLALNVVEC